MDRRNIPCLVTGVVSLGFGTAAVLVGSPLLVALAGMCTLVLTIMAFDLVRQLQLAENEAGTAIELMMNREIDHARQKAAGSGASGIDPLTNLPDRTFFNLAVKGRVATARRHLWPVSVVLLELVLKDEAKEGQRRAETLSAFTKIMDLTLREADIACRIGDNTFALLLEDTPEEGGVWTAERLQIAIAKDGLSIRQISAGVSTYPTHGLSAEELVKRGNTALARAAAVSSSSGLGQVEVAVPE